MKNREDKLYEEATERFLKQLINVLQDEKALNDAIKFRRAITSMVDREEVSYDPTIFNQNEQLLDDLNAQKNTVMIDDIKYRIDIHRTNNSIIQYLGKGSCNLYSLKTQIELDAAIADAVGAFKQEDLLNYVANSGLSDKFDNIPKKVFETIDLVLLIDAEPDDINQFLLEMKIAAIGEKEQKNHPMSAQSGLFSALKGLENELIKTPNPVITKATIKLLDDISELPRPRDGKKIAAIFNTYEAACKKTNALQSILKAVAVVIITGIFFTAGITTGAVLGGAIGIAAGAWSGPGAAASAILGVFSGSLTGWAIAATATAAVTGVIFGATGAAKSSSLFFKQQPSDIEKAVANLIQEGKANLKDDEESLLNPSRNQ